MINRYLFTKKLYNDKDIIKYIKGNTKILKRKRIRRNIKKKKYLYNHGYISYKSYYSCMNSYNIR